MKMADGIIITKVGNGGKMKIQVTIDDEVVKKLDEYAKLFGTSRSAICSVAIGEKLLSYEKTINENISSEVAGAAK